MSAAAVTKPRQIFRPDPVLGWKLSPNATVNVRFRPDVTQTTDGEGWRTVTGAPANANITLGVYGCSFTYGTGLSDEETYVSRLQANFQDVRLLNRSCGGHSTVQNFIQFRRDVIEGKVGAAIFSLISDHRFRNVPHPQRMRQFLSPEWYELGIEHAPRALKRRDGSLDIGYVPIWQPSLLAKNFDVFLPDEHMLDSTVFAVLDAALALADEHKIPLVFAVLDCLDPGFNEAIVDRYKNAFDISVPFDQEHTFLPNDIHPNVHANTLFAERLLPHVAAMVETVSRDPK